MQKTLSLAALAVAAILPAHADDYPIDEIRDYCSYVRLFTFGMSGPTRGAYLGSVGDWAASDIGDQFDQKKNAKKYTAWLNQCAKTAAVPNRSYTVNVTVKLSDFGGDAYNFNKKELALHLESSAELVQLPNDVVEGWKQQIRQAGLTGSPFIKTKAGKGPFKYPGLGDDGWGNTRIYVLAQAYPYNGWTAKHVPEDVAEALVKRYRRSAFTAQAEFALISPAAASFRVDQNAFISAQGEMAIQSLPLTQELKRLTIDVGGRTLTLEGS